MRIPFKTIPVKGHNIFSNRKNADAWLLPKDSASYTES